MQQLTAEMNALAAHLQGRVVSRLADERDVLRRANVATFPAQIVGLAPLLQRFLADVFRPELEGVWLRGCYFTSGRQGGAPIDRLITAMANAFKLALPAPHANEQRGTSYFLETLLEKVVFTEAGLAGVNASAQRRRRVATMAAYALIGAVLVVGSTALATSYRANRAFVAEVASLEQTALGASAVRSDETLTIEEALARLDSLWLVWTRANQYRTSPPLSMRWGLFQGGALGAAAEDAYRLALNGVLGPWVSQHLAGQIRTAGAEPERLYEYLKAYLLLGSPDLIETGSNRAQLLSIGRLEWSRALAGQPTLAEQLSRHFEAWIDGRVTAVTIDERLVEQARTSLIQASLPALMYRRLRLSHASPSDEDLRLDRELVLGGDALLVRRSGRPLSDPLPAMYTKAAFEEFMREGRARLAQEFFIEDRWVFGDRAPPLTQAPATLGQVVMLYEEDYILAWENLLTDVTLRPFRDANDALAGLALLAAPTSPLKNLLLIVAQHTNLTAAPASPGDNAPAPLATAEAAAQQVSGLLGPPGEAGARVTAHFAAIHRLIEGPPGGAPIDRTLAELEQVRQELSRAGDGGASALRAVTNAVQSTAARLPPLVGAIVQEAGDRTVRAATGQMRDVLATRYAAQVLAQCAELIGNRYPANPSSNADVAIADFARMFGPNGVFNSFFQTELAPYVDTSGASWRWRSDLQAMGGVPLQQFQNAQRVRQAFFAPGGAVPEMRFTVTPEYLDGEVDRFTLTIDDQRLEYSHGRPRPLAVTWPSDVRSGVTFVFEEAGGARPSRTFTGPWALFRLFESARVERQSDTRFLVTLTAGGLTARLLVTAASVRNPLAQPELLRFGCGQ